LDPVDFPTKRAGPVVGLEVRNTNKKSKAPRLGFEVRN
jgi:hypothetical protein